MNMERLSTLLKYAVENLGPLDEIAATDTGVYFRLTDGRTGLLMMGPDNTPMASPPSEVMTA